MKAHKNWGIASLVCMIMAVYSGYSMKSKDAHKYWALGSLGCMIMAVYTGYRMTHKKTKKSKKKNNPEEGI